MKLGGTNYKNRKRTMNLEKELMKLGTELMK